MSWFVWLFLLYIAYELIGALLDSKRCDPHRVLGRCRLCEQETATRLRAQAVAGAEAQRRQAEINETYKSISAAKRLELVSLVKSRAERENLIIGPGDLEAAVVR